MFVNESVHTIASLRSVTFLLLQKHIDQGFKLCISQCGISRHMVAGEFVSWRQVPLRLQDAFLDIFLCCGSVAAVVWLLDTLLRDGADFLVGWAERTACASRLQCVAKSTELLLVHLYPFRGHFI